MSSSANAPYKSRLFNFLNRKSLQWGTQAQKVFRQAKEVAKVGGQVLLYLGYLSFQAGRMVGHLLQERQTRFKGLPFNASSSESYPPLPPDQPLQKVLEAVESWDLLEPGEETEPSKIQGIAACLETRSLVLVTETDRTIDILNPEQQKQLQQKITWEVADYHRSRRLGYQTHPFVSKLPPLVTQNSWISGLTQSVWTLMEKVQRSPLAINFNVFQESTWVKPLPPSPASNPTPPLKETFSWNLPNSDTLSTLDETIAEIELHPIASGRQFVKEIQNSVEQLKEHPNVVKLRDTLHAAIDYFFTPPNRHGLPSGSSEPQSLALTPSPRGLTESHQQRSRLDHEDDPFSLQRLLHAAVDYFFGTLDQDHLLENSGFPHQDQPLLNRDADVPWLSSQDLFYWGQDSPMTFSNSGEGVSSTAENFSFSDDPWFSFRDLLEVKIDSTESVERSDSVLLPQGLSTPGTPTGDLQTYVQESLEKQKSFSAILQGVATRFSPGTMTNFHTSSQKLTVKGSSGQTPGLDHQPEWVDTQAEPMGYIKHPLITIVELLDGFILWLEEVLVQFWSWWRKK